MAILKMYSAMFLFHLNCLGRRNRGGKVAEQEQPCPWSFLVAQFTCLACTFSKDKLWEMFLPSRFISACAEQLTKICSPSCSACSLPLPPHVVTCHNTNQCFKLPCAVTDFWKRLHQSPSCFLALGIKSNIQLVRTLTAEINLTMGILGRCCFSGWIKGLHCSHLTVQSSQWETKWIFRQQEAHLGSQTTPLAAASCLDGLGVFSLKALTTKI